MKRTLTFSEKVRREQRKDAVITFMLPVIGALAMIAGILWVCYCIEAGVL